MGNGIALLYFSEKRGKHVREVAQPVMDGEEVLARGGHGFGEDGGSGSAVASSSARGSRGLDPATRTLIAAIAGAVLMLLVACIGLVLPLIVLNAKARQQKEQGSSSRGEDDDDKKSRWFTADTILSYGNAFSGGVMLAAGFTHLLGEAAEQINKYDYGYPVAELFCGIGYLLTLVAENIVEDASRVGKKRKKKKASGGENGNRSGSATWNELGTNGGSGRLRVIENGDSRSEDAPEDEELGSTGVERQLLENEYTTDMPHENERTPLTESVVLSGLGMKPSTQLEVEADYKVEADQAAAMTENGALASLKRHRLDDDVAVVAPTSTKPLAAIVLTVGLSFHSVIEGVAVGSQSTLAAMETILVAVLLHKGLAAFVLSSVVMESQVKHRTLMLLIFAFASPVGIVGGALVQYFMHGSVEEALWSAIPNAIASGTFLYVAITEIIPSSLASKDVSKTFNLMLIFVGFAIMATLAIWA